MCDPATLATVALVSAVAGTGVSVYGSMQQGKAAQAQANYQSQVAKNNQIIAERRAEDAKKRGEIEEARHRGQVSQLIGRQRAVLAGNGVVVDEGSALDITSDTAAMGELDALTIRSNAEREAYGYKVQGANFAADAGLLEARGAAARSAGNTAAFSSLLSGAGSVADKWLRFFPAERK